MVSVKTILNDQSPNDDEAPVIKQLPLELVDELADELVKDYANPDFRKWYCKAIYDFGPEKIHEWRRRASEGKQPAKLFTSYVVQARRYRQKRRANNG